MSQAERLLDGALVWLGRLPGALAEQVSVDLARRRLRLSHGRVEALTRKLLASVSGLELRDWKPLPEAYDVRLGVKGWGLRCQVALERVELASGGYAVWLWTREVQLEESPAASLLVRGVLRAGAGTEVFRSTVSRLLPKGVLWDGECLELRGPLPPEGPVPARLFESSSLTVVAEHAGEGVWLSAEAWPSLLDLTHALLALELPRTPPGLTRG
jgi:hypothetical protein